MAESSFVTRLKQRFALSAVVSIVTLACLNFPGSAGTPNFVGATDTWTLVSHPSITPIGCCEAGYTIYHNNLDAYSAGIPVMVIRNNFGQTLYVSYVSLGIYAGVNGTAYNVIFNNGILQEGENYVATFFVIADSGVAMSNSTTTFVTFP
jgi:hypothetical protein